MERDKYGCGIRYVFTETVYELLWVIPRNIPYIYLSYDWRIYAGATDAAVFSN